MVLGKQLLFLALLLVPFTACAFKIKLMNNLRHLLMGIPSPDCDDAKTNLTFDWNNMEVNYTCYEKEPYPVLDLEPIEEHFDYTLKFTHRCMNDRIVYPDTEPVYGDHRPLWAVYGEYKFLPPQRWVHNLEHGGIVVLYHPCADSEEVDKLRQMAIKCNTRFVITPHNLLTKERPLVVMSYGCRLYMSKVDYAKTLAFIKENTMKAPETQEQREGQFTYLLETPAMDQTKVPLIHNETKWCVGM